MTDVFQNEKEPLYGRADRILYINPFTVSTIKQILVDYDKYNVQNLFFNFLLTGGVPRYIELFSVSKHFTEDQLIDQILEKNSFFIEEGKNLLI